MDLVEGPRPYVVSVGWSTVQAPFKRIAPSPGFFFRPTRALRTKG